MADTLSTIDATTSIITVIEEHTHAQTLQSADISSPHTIQDVKLSTSDQPLEEASPVHSSSPDSTSPEQVSDTVSTHSLPTSQVTLPDPPSQPRPSTARGGAPSHPQIRALPSPSRSLATPEDGSLSLQQRRARHRSAVESRSPNRLSGFFTNLIHRRDTATALSARNQATTHDDTTPSTAREASSATQSRSSSPLPVRPVTPPPSLPPPTLEELGLTLSVLTSDLAPSHFSTPPSSGAFLLPHYLLLCHAQGLDVLPLVSPPAPQPYALVRRVSFKSVVVMEQRGVLVAIAGRRDGVRVYALEEVKKAIEWRMDVEVRRERERLRRENVKKAISNSNDGNGDTRGSAEKLRKTSLSTPPLGETFQRTKILHKKSHEPISTTSLHAPPPPRLIPRSPTQRQPRKITAPTQVQIPTEVPEPSEHPPPYSSPVERPPSPSLRTRSSAVSINTRSRSGSVTNPLAVAPISRRNTDAGGQHDPDTKVDWLESSDDEAINIVAAGPSGSQALDERTSATLAAQHNASAESTSGRSNQSSRPISSPTSPPTRRNRPANLDLSLSRNAAAVVSEPSPSPTLLTLRQALSHSPPTLSSVQSGNPSSVPATPFGTVEDDDDDEVGGQISLAEVLLESRLPELPPLGTRRPQEPILIPSSHPIAVGEDEILASPRSSEGIASSDRSPNPDHSGRRRRRWSVIVGPAATESSASPGVPSSAPPSQERPVNRFTRSQSFRSVQSQSSTVRQTSEDVPALPSSATSHEERQIGLRSSRTSRFIPRIISSAFHGRRSEDRPPPVQKSLDSDNAKKASITPHTSQAPPPKLEYVKLPGTKGALLVKAVETAKKSFLAILCGDSGEKVELFAGTYRTALGLSRTFILPDSPRSLELQLQGDDLVEVFLVFSQNVFGLEPATVRVREVRIGRAERRAARRRARELRAGEGSNNDSEAGIPEEDTNVNVNIGVSVSVGSTVVATGDGQDRSHTPAFLSSQHPNAPDAQGHSDNTTPTTSANFEELFPIGTAQMGPYTTFQQLNFAPKFPLASIADEYIIPPTYPDFMQYRAAYEPDDVNSTDLTQVQFSPPGLPVPAPAIPSRWYYRDPKNVVHGPWKASLMQAWYKDGLLPPDLPVRREEDSAYTLLRDLRAQSIDPTHPFKSPPRTTPVAPPTPVNWQEANKPLLPPISLLSQPRHFGPPALFFSSRGGHSTTIVDARGRSVLKGRLMWSSDDQDDEAKTVFGRMGDIKRLEAFDVHDRSVVVAMRQGGLEAVDLSDALLKPADESRTVLPQFTPPPSNCNRRAPFVWKIGTPVSSSSMSTSLLPRGKGHSNAVGKKQSIGSTKSPAGRTEFSLNDNDMDTNDEVLFLGRNDDEIYICERNGGSFRILRLCPEASS